MIHIDIIYKSDLWKKEKISKNYINKVINIAAEYISFNSLCSKDNTEISCVLADNEFITKLNKNYRNIDKATNVLSFPTGEINNENIPEINLGDIILSHSKIYEESEKYQKSFINHFTHLLIHGFLHLIGYDHIKEDERKEMENIEISILEKLNIDNPYRMANNN